MALRIREPSAEMLTAGKAALRRDPTDVRAVFLAMLATSDNLWPTWIAGYDCGLPQEDEDARERLLRDLTTPV